MVFPLLQDPGAAFGLLLGKDVLLFAFDSPTLAADFRYNSPPILFFTFFGILSVYGEYYYGAKLAAHLRLGYDTYGLREYLKSGNVADVLDGFYVDTNGTYGSVTGYVGAQAAASIWIARAGVGGELSLTYTLHFVNPNGTGRLHASEMARIISDRGFFALFAGGGSISARLYVYAELLVPFVHVYKWGVDIGFKWEYYDIFSYSITISAFSRLFAPRERGAGPPAESRGSAGRAGLIIGDHLLVIRPQIKQPDPRVGRGREIATGYG